MTDVMMSPQTDMGKRSDGDEQFSFDREVSASHYHGLPKRHRHDRMLDDPSRQSFAAGSMSFSAAPMKRFRFDCDQEIAALAPHPSPFESLKAGGAQREVSSDSMVSAITANFQKELFRCHQEILRLQTIEASSQQVQLENRTLNDENKILKKAVAVCFPFFSPDRSMRLYSTFFFFTRYKTIDCAK